MPNSLHVNRVFSGGKKMSLKLRRLKFSLRHSEFPQLQTDHFPGSCVTLYDLHLSGWHREAMPAFCTVCSHTNPFLVMKYLQHTREYAHRNGLVWPSQKLCGSDFIILHFSQMRKPWPTDVVRPAQVYLAHNWSVWGLTYVSLTQTFVKPLYCVVLPLPCQGPLSFRKDIPLHHFHTPERPSILRKLNAYPLQSFILWEMKSWSRGTHRVMFGVAEGSYRPWV